ncbi:hypothetical protein PF003_g21647 [Phytophthora fragariae]|nr:hypothetical protein PF003_g21647 [Phytophthora fragariae]
MRRPRPSATSTPTAPTSTASTVLACMPPGIYAPGVYGLALASTALVLASTGPGVYRTGGVCPLACMAPARGVGVATPQPPTTVLLPPAAAYNSAPAPAAQKQLPEHERRRDGQARLRLRNAYRKLRSQE